MEDTLGKIQRLNGVFRKSATTSIPLDDLCGELGSILECNIYLFDAEGNIFAYSIANKFICPYTDRSLAAKELPHYYMNLFLENDHSVTNIFEENPICTDADVTRCIFNNRYYSIYPIYSQFKKTGGILFIRYELPFSEDNQILCEYTCAIVSVEMLRREQEKIKRRSMELAKAKLAVDFLTFSEKKAAWAVLNDIDWDQGEVFLNSIAAETFTTPSTVSSALKKLELASVITTESRGVKGKCVRVVNADLREQLD